MFQTEDAILEDLSFSLEEEDIDTVKKFLNQIKSEEILTIPDEEIEKALEGLEDIQKLKQEGEVYGFEIHDAYVAKVGVYPDIGVELFLRQGDTLDRFYEHPTRERVYQASEAAEYLKEQEIYTVHTGSISYGSDFLGLEHKRDEEDPITVEGPLPSGPFESKGIEVINHGNLA